MTIKLDEPFDQNYLIDQTPMDDTPTNYQIGGDHYKKNAIQPIDYIRANKLDFCEGNVIKYVTRWRYKNGIEDLKKARQYIEFLIETAENQNANV